MSKLEIKKLTAYNPNVYYLQVDNDASIHYSGEWATYDFTVYCDSQSIYKKLVKVQKTDGCVTVHTLEDNWSEDTRDDRWHYIIRGSISGRTPFQHSSITKTLVKILHG